LLVRKIPVQGVECKCIYERSCIWTAEKGMKTKLIIAVMHTTSAAVKCFKHVNMLRLMLRSFGRTLSQRHPKCRNTSPEQGDQTRVTSRFARVCPPVFVKH